MSNSASVLNPTYLVPPSQASYLVSFSNPNVPTQVSAPLSNDRYSPSSSSSTIQQQLQTHPRSQGPQASPLIQGRLAKEAPSEEPNLPLRSAGQNRGKVILLTTIGVNAAILTLIVTGLLLTQLNRKMARERVDIEGTAEHSRMRDEHLTKAHDYARGRLNDACTMYVASEFKESDGHKPEEIQPGGKPATPDGLNDGKLEPFSNITVLPNKNHVLIIDHAPPAGVPAKDGKLAYIFENGFKSKKHGVSNATFGIETCRAKIHLAVKCAANSQKNDSPGKDFYKQRREELEQSYTSDTDTLAQKGWDIGDLKTLPRHTWEQLRDFELGDPHALSANPNTRAFGRVKSAVKLPARGFKKAIHSLEECGYKGGRSVLISLPMGLGVGLAVSSIALAYMSDSSTTHKAQS